MTGQVNHLTSISLIKDQIEGKKHLKQARTEDRPCIASAHKIPSGWWVVDFRQRLIANYLQPDMKYDYFNFVLNGHVSSHKVEGLCIKRATVYTLFTQYGGTHLHIKAESQTALCHIHCPITYGLHSLWFRWLSFDINHSNLSYISLCSSQIGDML